VQKLTATFIAMFDQPIDAWLKSSIIARAARRGIFTSRIESIMQSVANHHAVDDTPYGGGAGELMKIDVIAPLIDRALTYNKDIDRKNKRVLLMDPAGMLFEQNHAKRLSSFDELIFVCGRYEGIDARIHHYVDETLSIGDFILSNGDLAALAICDATLRMIPGVLHNPRSVEHESYMHGRLEASHYTRPKLYDGHDVPHVLQSGDHQAIADFRLLEAAHKTKTLRPDLLIDHPLNAQEEKLINGMHDGAQFPWTRRHE
jgi:tRNA (guanine37-N1)-methyltransferase